MNALLICPWSRVGVPVLAEGGSLACAPLLGQGIVEYWLSHLACAGAKEILILADDHPEQLTAVVGGGERWGLKVEVIEEQRELTPAQAFLKYEKRLDPATAQNGITVLDHFPGAPEIPVFNTYKECFLALQRWMPSAKTPDRVGVQERSPGVQTGLHSHISPKAELRGPCWIGKHVFIGANAIIGPNAVIEDEVFIEPGASVTNAVIGGQTFVGQFAEIANSFAYGDTLVDIESGSAIKVPDRFLLCSLRHNRTARKAGILSRLGELCGKPDSQMLWKHLLLNKEGS
jgi:NDP-sugar pyrophosphorylase family protein